MLRKQEPLTPPSLHPEPLPYTAYPTQPHTPSPNIPQTLNLLAQIHYLAKPTQPKPHTPSSNIPQTVESVNPNPFPCTAHPLTQPNPTQSYLPSFTPCCQGLDCKSWTPGAHHGLRRCVSQCLCLYVCVCVFQMKDRARYMMHIDCTWLWWHICRCTMKNAILKAGQ